MECGRRREFPSHFAGKSRTLTKIFDFVIKTMNLVTPGGGVVEHFLGYTRPPWIIVVISLLSCVILCLYVIDNCLSRPDICGVNVLICCVVIE